jgi:predicted Zn-dependent peptidase
MNFLTTTYTVARTAALAGVLLLTSLGAMAQRQKPWENIKYPEAKNFTMPKVEEFKLPNGITFYLVENRELPVIDLNLVVRTGATEDPTGKEGLASMTGQLIREGGSASYPADKLNEMLEKQAAEIETGIGFNSGSASLRALTKDFNQLLPVFLDVILEQNLPLF